MTQRQSNNQWSGGLAAYHAPKSSECKNPLEVLALIFWNQDGILLIDYLPKGQTINVEFYSSLLVQLKNILKVIGHRKVTNAQQFPGSPGTCNPEETDLPGLPVSCSPTHCHESIITPMAFSFFKVLENRLFF
jgi:hypothetical protein